MAVSLKEKSFNPERQLYEFDIVNDGQVVGLAQLRLKASKGPDMPAGFESNIYYEIEPEQRGRGYATATLDQLLKFAQKRGLNPIIATVNANNAASIKVIEHNGSQLVAEDLTTQGAKVLKYSITKAPSAS